MNNKNFGIISKEDAMTTHDEIDVQAYEQLCDESHYYLVYRYILMVAFMRTGRQDLVKEAYKWITDCY